MSEPIRIVAALIRAADGRVSPVRTAPISTCAARRANTTA